MNEMSEQAEYIRMPRHPQMPDVADINPGFYSIGSITEQDKALLKRRGLEVVKVRVRSNQMIECYQVREVSHVDG